MNRKQFLSLATVATAALALPAVAAAADPKSFRALPRPVATDAGPGKIEVVEFFWFGCPHCFSLEPLIDKWAARLPADVEFRRQHVPFREKAHQQLYFTLQSMDKDEPRYRDAVFKAIHLDNKRMTNAREMISVLQPLGVDPKQFEETFTSFGVRTKMQRADKLADAYGLDGVPMLGVNGRYITAPSMAGSNERALQVVDELIQMERKAAR
jgi:thiol:disulfide interchange protein DsbA